MANENEKKIKIDVDTSEAKEELSLLDKFFEKIKLNIAALKRINWFVDGFREEMQQVRAEFDKEIDNFEQEIIKFSKFKVDYDIYDSVAKNIDGLKTVIEDLESELNQADFGTEKFILLAEAVGHYKTQLRDVKNAVEEIGTVSTTLETMVKVSENLETGFTGAQAAAEFFGLETGKLAKMLDKISNAQAAFNASQKLSKSVFTDNLKVVTKGATAKDKLASSIGGATKSFKLFNKAMSASVIGAIITAVATLAAYWDDIRDALRFTSSEQKELVKTSKENYLAEEGKLKTLEGQENIRKEQGATEKQILLSKVKQIEAIIQAGRTSLVNQKAELKSQIEAEERNKSILKGILKFVSAGISPILFMVDQIGKFFGEEFGLVEGFSELVASQFFDPEGVKKKGDEAIAETEARLNELENQASGYMLEVKEIDRKAWEDYVKRFKEQTENELKLLKERSELTEEIELKALADFKRLKIITESVDLLHLLGL